MKKLFLVVSLITVLIVNTAGSAAADIVICDKQAVSMTLDEQEALSLNKLIKTGYHGDYTLKWAIEHDYKESDKVKWVNLNQYASQSDYLVWVSIAYQRLNVFSGSTRNWSLVKTYIIGTGAPGRDTPVGTWKLLNKNPQGWSTSAYTVKPVITFINQKYGFHSRLYAPNSTKLYDGSIGFPCSHGCIRMYTEDLAWFSANVPVGTTVIVY